MKIPRNFKALVISFLFIFLLTGGGIILAGCSSSKLAVGQKLYLNDGTEFGTIVQLENHHRFENGDVEPGALVDYRPRIDDVAWIPQRSVKKMVR